MNRRAAALIVVMSGPGDTTAPTLAITLSDTALKTGDTSTITFTFSEVPVGFAEADVTAPNGALSGFGVTADPLVYTAVFTPTPNTTDATNVITVGTSWTDAAGNAPAGATTSDNYTVDTAAPTVAITSTESSPTAASPIPITITVSEEVTGFVVGDLTVGNGTAGDFATADNIVFTANITPDWSGNVTVDVAAGVCTDVAGNENTAATQFDIGVIVVQDSFTDTDATALASHTLNVNRPTGAWTVLGAGAISILSNRAVGGAQPAYPGNVGSKEAGLANCVVSGIVRLSLADLNSGLVVRLTDVSNMFILNIAAATNVFSLNKFEGGSNTVLDSASVEIAHNTDYTIEVVLNGNTITATLDGANEVTAESTFNNTATKHGMQLRANNQICDDFLVHTDF